MEEKVFSNLMNYEIPSYIKRRFWLEKAPKLTKAEIDEVFDSLKEFLFLAWKNEEMYLSSYIVDEAWHTFILFTREYFSFCETVFGKYMHHSPSIEEGGYKSDTDLILKTYKIFKKEFPESKIFEHDKELNIWGSDYKGIIFIQEDKEKIAIYLNNEKIREERL